MKKVLVILYYWPPTGGSGVQRGLYFVKYLREFGWEPIVYTPENPEMPAIDNSLEKEIPDGLTILKTPIWEPYKWYKRITGQKEESRIKSLVVTEKKEKRNWAHKLSVWIRGNFFIPDARVFWVNPSVRFLKKYLEEHPVDAIFSSSPPQSMHLIAQRLHDHFGIPWIADFRDPWTGISYFNELGLTQWARNKHHRLEKKVLTSANEVTTVSQALTAELGILGNRSIELITNGFDERKYPERGIPDPERFILSYVGTLSRDRNPVEFWKQLADYLTRHTEIRNRFTLRMIGPIDDSVFHSIEQSGLDTALEKIEYIPHEDVPGYLDTSHALLLIGIPGGTGVLTGKLFEYLDAQRFILSIGPEDGDVVSILKDTGAGVNADFSDTEAIREAVTQLFERYRTAPSPVLPRKGIEQYSRRALTGKLARCLDRITSGHSS